jgi:hypothetical protein
MSSKTVYFPFTCSVCNKKYSKSGAHKLCYKRFCMECNLIFEKNDDLKSHALEYHRDKFCSRCNYVVSSNVEVHKRNYHK